MVIAVMRSVVDSVIRYWPLVLAFCVAFFNEYLIFYTKIGLSCSWPCKGCKPGDLRIFLISDTHLLGDRRGHWLDKLQREWQMYRSYHSAVQLLSPKAVFFLGDLTDEGLWGDYYTFHKYADRFDSLFGFSGKKPEVHVLAGNHDLGFHYAISPFRVDWFEKRFNSSSVEVVVIDKQPFILLTSMAMHRDGCRFCHEAETAIQALADELTCARSGDCGNKTSRFLPYRRPILLQHFPLFRVNDDECLRDDDFDRNDPHHRIRYRPTWDSLSDEATQFLLTKLEPRAVFNGHTHSGCKKRWTKPVEFWEYTVNSFSWRNGDGPTFLLATISENEVHVNVCHLPHESTVIQLFYITGFIVIIWLLRKFFPFIRSMCSRARNCPTRRSPSADKLLKTG